jgi:hypothetical protein
MTMRTLAGLAAVAVLASGCQVLNFFWAVPATVPAGAVFAIEIDGNTDASSGDVGAVLQLPNGFTVVAATGFANASNAVLTVQVVRNEAALLASYSPDPGHYLASFSGYTVVTGASTFRAQLKVYVRAPSAAGAHVFELALAAENSAWTPQLGLGSFQTVGGSTALPLQVVAAPPPPPFALRDGQWNGPTGLALDIELADIDGDGRDDMVELVGGYFVARRSVPGGFAPPWPAVAVPLTITDFTAGDCDGDGYADVALANGAVFFRNSSGPWSTTTIAHGLPFASVAAGDVDGDGITDLAFAQGQTVVVHRGQPNRTFLPWSQGLPALGGMAPAPLRAVDLDGDGRAEIVAGANVLRSTPQGAWLVVGQLSSAADVIALDVDGDGDRELLTAGAHLFQYTPQAVTFVPGFWPAFKRAVALDHDRDGYDDVILAGWVPGSRVELWRNTGGALLPTVLPPGSGFASLPLVKTLVTGDLDGDTFLDLAGVLDRGLAWRNSANGAASYGAPCAAAGVAPPQLAVVGALASGQPTTLWLSGASPGAGALLWIGHSNTTWFGQPLLPFALDFVGAPGCHLLAEPLQIVGATANAAGIAVVPFTMPVLPFALEVALFAQGAAADPAANPLGVALTRGLVLKVQ